MPRAPRVQCNRSNVSTDTPLLYERSIGIPFIDILLQQLHKHFSADNWWPVSPLLSLIQSLIVKLGMPPPDQFESWHDRLLTPRSLDNEVSRWLNTWSRADLPDILIKSLVSTDSDSFLNIRILLVLGCTLLTTSAEAERSFSVLRLIKGPLRSWLADKRFSGLTLMKLHYNKHTDSPKNCS